MTTEDALQAALDDDPSDATIRLVLADLLDEQGDPRGPGYRALGMMCRYPMQTYNPPEVRWWDVADRATPKGPDDLPGDWIQAINGSEGWYRATYAIFRHRMQADNAAALAFAKLPPARQAELLGQHETVLS